SRESPRLPLVARARGLERARGRGAAPIDRATRELSLLGLEPRERVHRLGERALSLAEARLDEALLRPPERAGQLIDLPRELVDQTVGEREVPALYRLAQLRQRVGALAGRHLARVHELLGDARSHLGDPLHQLAHPRLGAADRREELGAGLG